MKKKSIPTIIMAISKPMDPPELRPIISARVTSEKPNNCKKRARNMRKNEFRARLKTEGA